MKFERQSAIRVAVLAAGLVLILSLCFFDYVVHFTLIGTVRILGPGVASDFSDYLAPPIQERPDLRTYLTDIHSAMVFDWGGRGEWDVVEANPEGSAPSYLKYGFLPRNVMWWQAFVFVYRRWILCAGLSLWIGALILCTTPQFMKKKGKTKENSNTAFHATSLSG